MYTVLKVSQLRWTGHVIRMHDERLPKKVFYGEAVSKRSEETPQRHPKSLSEGPPPTMGCWRGLINKKVGVFEEKRICEAKGGT